MEGYEFCYAHRPDLAAQRRQDSRKGGLAGGRSRAKGSEMAELKHEAARLYGLVLAGEVAPSVGAVGVQALNLRSRLWESEGRAALAESEIMAAEQLARTRSRIVSIIAAHVKDREVLAAIAADMRREDDAPKELALYRS